MTGDKIRLNKEQKNILHQFLLFHFPYDKKYNGNVIFNAREKDANFMKFIGFSRQNQLDEDIRKRTFYKEYDYYLTKNTFVSYVHSSDMIFGFQNIVIDIDIHYNYPEKEIEKLCQRLVGKIFDEDDSCLKPNSVVFTGRGIQLWYHIFPLCYKYVKSYDQMVKILCQMLKDALTGDALPTHVLDQACSVNAAGLVRMPYTYNTKSKKLVTVQLYHNQSLDVLDYIYSLKEEKKRNSYQTSYKNHHGIGTYRYQVLHRLRELRSEYEEGNRDLYLFVLYCSAAEELGHDTAMEMIRQFNQEFKVPLTEKEIESYLSSARKKQYRISNQKIKDLFAITPEEEITIGLVSAKKKEKAFSHMTKEQHEEIKRLAEQGLNKSQIAKEIGVSNAAIGKYMKAKGIKTKKEKFREKVFALLKKENSLSDICQKLHTTASKVRHIQQAFLKKEEEKREKKRLKEEEARKKQERDLAIEGELKDFFQNRENLLHQTVDSYYDPKSSFCSEEIAVAHRRKMLGYDDFEERMASLETERQRLHLLIDQNLYLPDEEKKVFIDLVRLLKRTIEPYMEKTKKGEIAEKYGVSKQYLNQMIREKHLDPEREEEERMLAVIKYQLYFKVPKKEIWKGLRLCGLSPYQCRHLMKKARREMDASKIYECKKKMKSQVYAFA